MGTKQHKAKRHEAGHYTYRGFTIDREMHHCMHCDEAHIDSNVCDDPMLETVWNISFELWFVQYHYKLKDCKKAIDEHVEGIGLFDMDNYAHVRCTR